MVRRLSFVPSRHGWHFPNAISTDVAGVIRTYGLCGGMVLSAVNYLRHNVPIPSLRWSEIPSFALVNTPTGQMINVPTGNPGLAHPVFDFILHSQIATFQSGNIHNQVVMPWDNNDATHYRWSTQDEFPKVKRAIDGGCYVILGLRSEIPGDALGHQTLVYGYDDTNRTLFMYDPNHPDEEVVVNGGDGTRIRFSGPGTRYRQYRSYYFQLELNPNVRSTSTTYDVIRNQTENFSVRPPYTDPVGGRAPGFTGNGTYTIQSKVSGKYLDIDVGFLNTGGRNNGALLQQWDFANGNNQKFRIEDVGGGFWRFSVLHTNKSLDVAGVSTADNVAIQQWDYWGGGNQQFSITLHDGIYYKILARHSAKSLDVYGFSRDNGAKIKQYSFHGGDNQQWVFRRI